MNQNAGNCQEMASVAFLYLKVGFSLYVDIKETADKGVKINGARLD